MENYYSILGVSNTATLQEIKRVYLKLAQKYHPDRYTEATEKKQAHDHFSKITESYRVLSDEKLRAQYDESLREGKKPGDEAKETQAKNAFKRAIAFLKQNDPWRAVNLLRIACRYDEQPLYLSYLGLALVYTRQYQQEGFEKLKSAAKQVMFNPMLHINLGLAYEFVKKNSEALQSYYEALNWDNNNSIAQKAVKRLEGQKKGFFGRIFGGKT